MQQLRRWIVVLIIGCLCAPSLQAVEFDKKDFRLFGYHTQEHLWLSAGGTFIGAKIFDLMGMDNGPATALSGVIIFGAGMSKEFILDGRPGVNDIIADSLGVLIGSVASVTIHFEGYFDGKTKTKKHAKDSSTSASFRTAPL